ncbi:hypothetical protein LNV23_17135 [Paucibacter sp. DJ1R-11]|uniref:hypothetical protein n=1 Tax=Paucibacter sp. DJ1R-11 TaxID=2893556 RepID=UPI0021E4A6A6|nr:hypothetical protein [Paucibacter sp. DJ1R-11]MCV2365173.1 hypothetical protein [Paucibacter sp. DJ1R-11]
MELAEIESARAAWSFALGCLILALKLSLAEALPQAWRRVAYAGGPTARHGAACASAAVLAGSVFMAWAGAPKAWPWMNCVSLVFALASLALLPRQRLQSDASLRASLCLWMGTALLVSTALEPTAGLSGRWLRLGPVAVQPTWLLLPSLFLLSQRLPGAASAAMQRRTGLGLLLAMAGLTAQMEMCWLLLLGCLLLLRSASQQSGPGQTLLACLALLCAGVASQSWQAPPAQAFVDQVLLQAWAEGSGLALSWLVPATLLLLWPAWRQGQAGEHGLLWAGILLLSLPGWLPTPLLGMGGSAILGYVLSLAAVPESGTRLDVHRRSASAAAPPPEPPRRRRLRLALPKLRAR